VPGAVRMRLLVALFLVPAGCGLGAISSAEPDAGADASPRPTVWPESYDMHRLLEDEQILGGQHISVAEVQDFLVIKGSYLAGYTDPVSGQDAATIMVERSRAYGVSPLYMIARVQTESSLITSGTASNLDKATGCGCPDGGGCNPELGGFGNQIECAAEKMRAYHDELEESGVTRAGWQVGVMKMTSDPCVVTPANRATAMLYTYTPWVGAYGEQCGTPMWGGSSLVALAYHRYWVEYDWSL
jgi:hypothetical protein